MPALRAPVTSPALATPERCELREAVAIASASVARPLAPGDEIVRQGERSRPVRLIRRDLPERIGA